MKLHLGCGTVYLRDWVNVDLPSEKTFLAIERPDLVDKFITSEEEGYYSRHKDKTRDKLRSGPLDQQSVCDRYGSFKQLPARPNSVSEILARHVFEHMSVDEAGYALEEVRRVLQPRGILRLDVPDHEATMKMFQETQDSFYIRHLLGPRRGDYGFHMMSYSPGRLKSLVESHHFVSLGDEPNPHWYPAFTLRFEKR
jgi:hypothetical protein